MRGITLALAALVLAMPAASPAFAKKDKAEAEKVVEVTDPALLADIGTAETRGRLMWLYDQAAWHGTDAMMADLDPSKVEGARGYVVVPREGDAMLDVIFVAEREGALLEFARYTVDTSTVVSGGPVEGDLPALSPLAERLFKARGPALEAMGKAGYRLCSREPANTLALPPDEHGHIAFYLLTSTRETKTYPIGGHFRADIAEDGSVAGTTRYMNSCFDLPTAQQINPNGDRGWAGVSYLMGDTPSEIHVFASLLIPPGFMVITSRNDKLWLVEQGKITLKQDNFKGLK
ncbi:MAG: hypothetical protein H6918_05710 [Sphingomonadaceae bacterium]|nr:hypothetical protein [Sphingomonadaceae bacterium]